MPLTRTDSRSRQHHLQKLICQLRSLSSILLAQSSKSTGSGTVPASTTTTAATAGTTVTGGEDAGSPIIFLIMDSLEYRRRKIRT